MPSETGHPQSVRLRVVVLFLLDDAEVPTGASGPGGQRRRVAPRARSRSLTESTPRASEAATENGPARPFARRSPACPRSHSSRNVLASTTACRAQPAGRSVSLASRGAWLLFRIPAPQCRDDLLHRGLRLVEAQVLIRLEAGKPRNQSEVRRAATAQFVARRRIARRFQNRRVSARSAETIPGRGSARPPAASRPAQLPVGLRD